ncbi:MAG: hypothetical protein F6K25_25790 [Okeania sp. SIO2G4]|uniref:hypothetical protein n=1 Tax=unclassified Okeania TaxID=2634635 RepID=UPI0013BCC8F7|nr:hypothetical protein [Okeania sp. SIO2H7]NEP75015.1 hypothetical protein [Okeania sp. SIO2G5]NEP96067.1 hypothetical protein [Okeania sp. SIO2F5]NEQ93879.1 hypothetical protein [Okeania sp. SIO2G4]
MINKIFGFDIAKAGAGRAVTTEYTKYSPHDYDRDIDLPINLYDSPGYEAGKEEDFVKKTIDFLKDKSRQGEKEQVHLIWYLISASSARLTQADIDIIEAINNNYIPAIIVLSKCDIAQPSQKEQLKKVIEEELQKLIKENLCKKIYKIAEVAAQPLISPNGMQICEPFGIKELVNLTTEVLSNSERSDAFIFAQVVDIESKRELAWKYISEASYTSFGVGAVPLPLTAPIGIIGALSYMYSRIMLLYGQNSSILRAISEITLGGMYSFLSDAVLDLIPGTSILTGASAFSFTLASGMSLAKACEELAIEKLPGLEPEVKEELKRRFREKFWNYLKNVKIDPRKTIKIIIDEVGRDFLNKK